MKLQIFELDPVKGDSDKEVQALGIARGAVIQTCREVYNQALAAIIKFVSLQTTFILWMRTSIWLDDV